VRSVRASAGQLQLGVADLTQTTPAVLQTLQAQGLHVQHLRSGRATLEDVFLSLTGRQLRD
jgi:ABC-2 type transport system ATP-binding protein